MVVKSSAPLRHAWLVGMVRRSSWVLWAMDDMDGIGQMPASLLCRCVLSMLLCDVVCVVASLGSSIVLDSPPIL